MKRFRNGIASLANSMPIGIVNVYAGTYSETESEAILPHFFLKQLNLES